MSRVLISIDHKWRDIPDRVYLGILLERAGHSVRFTRNGFEYGAAAACRADAVIYNHVYNAPRLRETTVLQGQGVAVIVVPTEGMGMIKEFRKLLAGGFHRFDSVDLMTTWNDYSRTGTIEAGAITANRIITTGAPRFDFYRPPLNAIQMTRTDFCAKYALDAAKPVVTVATNFTHAIVPEQRAFYLADLRQMSADKAIPFYEQLPAMEYETRERLIGALRNLVRELEGVNIVLRPHPGEPHSFYAALAEELSRIGKGRVALPLQEYFWDVLAATDLLVQRSCTTGYEAWLRGLPVLELRLRQGEWYASEDHEKGCDVITGDQMLLDRIKFYLGGGAIPEDQKAARTPILNHWFGPLDGLAMARTAEAIGATLADRAPARWSARVLPSSLKYAIQSAGDFFLYDLKHYRFGRYDRLGRVDRHVKLRDVAAWRARLTALPASAS